MILDSGCETVAHRKHCSSSSHEVLTSNLFAFFRLDFCSSFLKTKLNGSYVKNHIIEYCYKF